MTYSITNIIYDMDGLLLDTEPLYTKAHQVVAARYGKTFDWTVKSKMIGLPAQDSARVMIGMLQLPLSVDEYLKIREPLLEELFPQAEPMPGAARLTNHLHRKALPQAVASSSNQHHFDLKTSRHKGWFSIFNCIVLGDDAEIKRGKPNPDIFLITAKRLQAPPEKCLVIEDSPAGIAAARAAGMYTLAVPDPNMSDGEYSNAHQIIRNLHDFDLSYWSLPPL
jgi:pseudouridine-5'-monophosphatase